MMTLKWAESDKLSFERQGASVEYRPFTRWAFHMLVYMLSVHVGVHVGVHVSVHVGVHVR